MPILVSRLNHRLLFCYSLFTGESIGIYKRCGDLRYLPFYGFAELDHARWMQSEGYDITPVQLDVYGYYLHSRVGEDMKMLKPGECVQGCMYMRDCVYAVVEHGLPKIIQRRDS